MGTLIVVAILLTGLAAFVWLGNFFLTGATRGATVLAEQAELRQVQSIEDRLDNLFSGEGYVIVGEYHRDGVPERTVKEGAEKRGYEFLRQDEDRLHFRKAV